jgi:hypothetical protein
VSYALSKARPESSVAELAGLKRQRHFIECSNQEAKSELGWDEWQALQVHGLGASSGVGELGAVVHRRDAAGMGAEVSCG